MHRIKALKQLICIALFLLVAGCAHVPPEATRDKPQQEGPYLSLMLARDAENRGNWKEALRLYATIDDPFTWLAQARIHFILNQSDSALDYVDRLIEQGTYADEALELRTKIYARKGNWDQAIADTEVLVEKYPENPQLKLFLANLKIVVSDFTGARETLESLLGSPDDSMILYTLSKACFGAKDFDCAKKALSDVIDIRSNFLPAYLDLGKIHELLGDKKQAEEMYMHILEVDPSSNDALIALSELYVSQSRYAEAITLLEILRKANPNVQILRKLIMLKLQEGLFEEALADLSQIEEKTNEDQYYLAIAYARLGRFDSALEALETIPISSPLGCEAAVLKSTILKDTGNMAGALEVLNAAWESFPERADCSEVGYQLATELDNAGRRDEGLDVAMKLLEKNPHDPVALNFAGYIWADEGINLDKAYAMISEALDKRPEDPFILDSMAWVLFKMNRANEALGYMKKALEKLGSDPVIHEHMGDILKSLGKRDEALDYYIKSSILNNTRSGIHEKIDELLE